MHGTQHSRAGAGIIHEDGSSRESECATEDLHAEHGDEAGPDGWTVGCVGGWVRGGEYSQERGEGVCYGKAEEGEAVAG